MRGQLTHARGAALQASVVHGPEDVFADLGSGKGRLHPGGTALSVQRVIGVELSDELTRVACANRDRQPRLLCPSVEFVTADLTRWEMAPDLTRAYNVGLVVNIG